MTTPGEVTRAILRDLPPGAVVPEHIGPVVLKHVTAMYEALTELCPCGHARPGSTCFWPIHERQAVTPTECVAIPATMEEFEKHALKGRRPVSGPWIPTLRVMEVGGVIRIVAHEHMPDGKRDCVTRNMLWQSAKQLRIKIAIRHDGLDLLVLRRS